MKKHLKNNQKRFLRLPMLLLSLVSMVFVFAKPGAVPGAALPGGITLVDGAYYVSQSTGNDSYDGLSPQFDGTHGPWKTLTRASQITFTEGNQLLLKCGDTWTDGLELKGNGSAANPAVVSSYGAGAKPKIDRQDPSMENMKRCISLNGNAYGWKIMNLELANGVHGVWAMITESGHSYLWFENLYIHGCKHGGPFPKTDGDQNNQQEGIRIWGPIVGHATITSCTFEDNFVGVRTNTPCDVTNNLFKHMEWTAMWYTADGGLIRGNKFMHNCDQYVWCGVSSIGATGSNWVVEYNEFGETQRQGVSPDGEDFDFEANCRNDTVRYNLFHETAGPASMIYNGAGHDRPNLNISVHDNVLYNSALNPSTNLYNKCILIIGDGHTGEIVNNRIYYRKGIPTIAGGSNPGLITTGNSERIMEDEPLGANTALVAKASASSNSHNAGKVNDDSTSTVWVGASASNEWVQLDFGINATLDKFIVEQTAGSSINNFILQYWDGSNWKDIFTSWSPMGTTRYMPTWTVSTSKVRLYVNSTASGVPSISEFRAFNTKQAKTAMTTTICNGVGFTVINGMVPAGTTYSWAAPVVTGGLTGGAAGINAANISGTLTNPTNAAQTATYTILESFSGSAFTVTVTVNPTPTIKPKWGDVLICYNLGDLFTSYQWYKDSSAIPGAIKQYYVTNEQPGAYMVETIDKDGCKNCSPTILISGTNSLSVYPNPASVSFSLKLNDESEGRVVVSILNSAGIKVMEFQAENMNDELLKEIPVNNLDEGIYVVQVLLNHKDLYYAKIVVIK